MCILSLYESLVKLALMSAMCLLVLATVAIFLTQKLDARAIDATRVNFSEVLSHSIHL